MPALAIQSELEQLAQEYSKALSEQFGPRLVSVVLFGSVARRQAGPNSDIDLLIIVEGLPSGRFARKSLFERVDERFWPRLLSLESQGISCRFNRIILSPEEASEIKPLYLDMVEDAVLLIDRTGFFNTILDRLRARLRELGSTRQKMGEVSFWDLKPGLKPGERFNL